MIVIFFLYQLPVIRDAGTIEVVGARVMAVVETDSGDKTKVPQIIFSLWI